ncbi:putative hydratase/decarboxylase [Flexivirga endophytica]|uniref:Hydratase/decarboxylase n=1 Tax=Flexivirga endophytica TaxID=1849103 RepID=A0A916SXB5_9MICO|nr:fumarylacetoacetate hydrolase family protein [Flexivirga endophytica]GGB22334.1 putative hydratase/decarboxylase [Flexivirga endophytica]GHB56277.1 putative hydratase/decarboxylase [Flexivirga endophytica]
MTQTNQDQRTAVESAATRLRAAAESGVACAPVRDLIGSDDVATAYAVQAQLAAERVQRGARVVGRKIGLTSVAVQQQLGVDQPDFGILFSDMAHETGATVEHASVIQPRVEGEVAFVLRDDLADGELDLPQVREAIDYAVAAIEICGSRIQHWDITFGDTVADNASAGAYVLGTQHRTLDAFEPRDVEMTMTVTGEQTSTGNGAACVGDPLVAVQWLARQARELGEPLRAGQVILSGALGPMRPVAPGAVATAEITGLGSVSVTFSNPEEA